MGFRKNFSTKSYIDDQVDSERLVEQFKAFEE